MLHIYADESCKDAHQYMAMGAVAVDHTVEATIVARLMAVRAAHNTFGEVKWTKISRAKLDFYKAFVDVFFDASKTDDMHFYGLHVNTHTFNHRQWNQGEAEIGFSKLIFQLLLHKFGRRYGADYPLTVYLDSRSTRHDPDDMRPMLNSELAKRWEIPTRPFRRITFIDSKKSDLIQVNDLLIGTIGFLKNKHHRRPDCSAHKKALAAYILKRATECEPAGFIAIKASRFSVWRFAYKKGS